VPPVRTPLRAPARLGLLTACVLLAACAGQDLARRDGIAFRHSRLASFSEISPDDPCYTRALAGALRATSLRREDVPALPRVVKGGSLLVDPPYLGRTAYLEGAIFVWEGTEVPLDEVLTHEMIHWVLYQAGMPDLARNEAYVARLTASVVTPPEDPAGFQVARGHGATLADRAYWYDLEVRRRNADRKRGERLDRMEPDLDALSFDRARSWVPQHPPALTP
jgi:hypothetical protein